MTTETLPTSQEEFEESLHDKDRMKALWNAGPDAWAEFCRGYAKNALEAKGGDLGKVIGEGLQAGMQEWLAGNRTGEGTGVASAAGAAADIMAREAANARSLNAGLPMNQLAAKNKLFNKRALGAQLDSEPYAASIGQFLQGVLATKKENSDTVRNFEKKFRNAMSERVPSSGGFLVPETLRSQLLMVALEN